MKTKPVGLPFSVADAIAGPELHWANDRLTLAFSDFLGAPRIIGFNEVSHFEWLAEDELDPAVFPYDRVVEVVDSPVIARLVETGAVSDHAKNGCRHWVIGFNEACAYLVVIFRDFDFVAAESGSDKLPS